MSGGRFEKKAITPVTLHERAIASTWQEEFSRTRKRSWTIGIMK